MRRIITKPKGNTGLMVKVEAAKDRPGEYHVGVYYRAWVGTMNSEDGMGWSGVGLHGTEKEMKKLAKIILEGMEKERPAVEQILLEHAKKTLAEQLDKFE